MSATTPLERTKLAIAVMTAWCETDRPDTAGFYVDTASTIAKEDPVALIEGLVSLCGFFLLELERREDVTADEILRETSLYMEERFG